MENLFHDVLSIIKTVVSTVQLLDTVFGSASQPSCYSYVTTSCIQITQCFEQEWVTFFNILEYTVGSRMASYLMEKLWMYIYIYRSFSFTISILDTHNSSLCLKRYIFRMMNLSTIEHTVIGSVSNSLFWDDDLFFTLRSRRVWLEVSVGQSEWM